MSMIFKNCNIQDRTATLGNVSVDLDDGEYDPLAERLYNVIREIFEREINRPDNITVKLNHGEPMLP